MPNEYVSRTRYEQNKKFLQHLNKWTNKENHWSKFDIQRAVSRRTNAVYFLLQ